MQVSARIGGTGDMMDHANIRTELPGLLLDVAEREGPRSIGLTDRVPQVPGVICINKSTDVQVSVRVGCASHLLNRADLGTGPGGLVLHSAEGKGPRSICSTDCVPQIPRKI